METHEIVYTRQLSLSFRFVNHTLANLSTDDFNPVALKHATPVQQGEKPGFTRSEGLEWAKKVEEEMKAGVSLEGGGTKDGASAHKSQ